MAHEMLSIKLCELEDQIARLISRIHLSETASPCQLEQAIEELRQECVENELTLQKKLQLSRAGIVSDIAQTYAQIEQVLDQRRGSPRAEESSEEKLLMAEYALDFALQAANRALLTAMEAIDTQLTQQEENPL